MFLFGIMFDLYCVIGFEISFVCLFVWKLYDRIFGVILKVFRM